MRYRYKNKTYIIKPFTFVCLFIIIIAIVAVSFVSCSKKGNDDGGNSEINSGEQSSQGTESDASSGESQTRSEDVIGETNQLPEGSLDDWNLILLNTDEENKLDANMDIKKVKFDTQTVDARIAPAYQEMYDAALKDGIILYLRSGYRSLETQEANYNNNVARLKNEGKTEEEAIRLTDQYYTRKGHSEHHSGLACDIITPQYHNQVYTLDERFAETEAYGWLVENSYKYGFVLRYPKDKVDITKINYEPWHYRFVGKTHAQYMFDNNLCLEEYLKLFK